jgi:hypothetical protein
LLAVGVTERGAQEATLPADALVLGGHPREERVGVRAQVQVAQRFDLVGRLLPPRPIELENPTDARESFACDRVFGDRRLPELAARVRLMPSTG